MNLISVIGVFVLHSSSWLTVTAHIIGVSEIQLSPVSLPHVTDHISQDQTGNHHLRWHMPQDMQVRKRGVGPNLGWEAPRGNYIPLPVRMLYDEYNQPGSKPLQENQFINPSPFYIRTPQDQGTGYDNEDEDSDRRYARAVDYMEEINGNEGNGESKKYYKDWILEN